MPTTWYIARDGKSHGPITDAEFAEFLRRGHLQPSDYIWHEALDDWVPGEKLLSEQRNVAEPTVPTKGARSLRGTLVACGRFLPPWRERPQETRAVALAYLIAAAILAPVGWGVYRSLF